MSTTMAAGAARASSNTPSNLETNPGETTSLYFKEPKLVRELKTIRQEYKESCRHGIGNTWPCQVDLLLEALVDDRGAD